MKKFFHRIRSSMPKNATTATCLITLFVSFHSSAQEQFELQPGRTRTILKDYNQNSARVFKVVKTEIDYKAKGSEKLAKRTTYYMAQDGSMPVDSLSGTFVKLPGLYRAVLKNVGNEYVQIELVIKEFADMKEMSREGELIQRKDTEEYYS